jgi:hypothetical protein
MMFYKMVIAIGIRGVLVTVAIGGLAARVMTARNPEEGIEG